MVPAAIAMIVILVVAAIVLAVVILGMQGTGRHRLPEVSHTLARAGQHLNGEAEPPRGLVVLFEEAGEGADDIRQLPEHLRRRSATTAASARSALSARTARSAGSPSDDEAFADPALAPEFQRRPDAPAVDSAWDSTEVQAAWTSPDEADAAAPEAAITTDADAAPDADAAAGVEAQHAASPTDEDAAATPKRALPAEEAPGDTEGDDRQRRPRSARWFRSPKAAGPDAATTDAAPSGGSAAAAASGAVASGVGAGSAGSAWGVPDADAAASTSTPGRPDDYELAEEFSLLAGLEQPEGEGPADGSNAWAVWSTDKD